MLPAFLLALREGVEIVLIISIVLGTLRKINRGVYNHVVWVGVIGAVISSALVAIILLGMGASLSGKSEQIFEGFTMLLAALLLTWMIFWMQTQARSISTDLEVGVRHSVFRTNRWALFFLAFIAVLREGTELAIFFTATALATNPSSALIGTALGLVGAVAIGFAIFSASIRLDIRMFFQFTGALLVLFAAGLIGHGVHELNEAGILPAIVEHVWDLSPLLDDQSTLGTMLKVMFGYNANPSLMEMLAYFLYLGGVIYLLWRNKSSSLISQNT